MLFSLFVGVIAFTLLYLWLVLHRITGDGDGGRARGPGTRRGARRPPGRGGGVVSGRWRMLAMEDAGFMIGSYVITFAVVGALAWRIVRRGRQLAPRIDDADKYWT